MQYAAGVVRMCEALLRDAAASCAAAAQLHTDREWAAAADAATAQKATSGLVTALGSLFSQFAKAVASVAGHEVTGEPPHHPSALALAALAAGPGSDLQQQLYSLLCSMVKLGRAPIAAGAPSSIANKSAEAREGLVRAAAHTAAALIVGDTGAEPQPDLASSTGSQMATGSAVSKLPGVFILGSCCMIWSYQLHNPVETVPQESDDPEAQGLWSALEAIFGATADRSDAADGQAKPHVAEHVLPPVKQWLQVSSTQEQLIAAGYAPQALPQQLQLVAAALLAARENAGSSQPDADQSVDAAQQLQAAGRALCAFAVPCLCNSPSCSNMSGLTELGLVSGRSCVCGGCRVARYCGRACQRLVWKQHMPLCAALAATAAATQLMTASASAAAAPAASP